MGSGGIKPGDYKRVNGKWVKKKDGHEKDDSGTKTPDGTYYAVPPGSYDPAIEAQRRAAKRGLEDLRDDTKTANKWARKDLGQSLFDIKRGFKRDRGSILRSAGREKQKLGLRKFDLNRDADRGRADLGARLAGVKRDFGQLAGRQLEARNAAGTLQGGTAAASAAKRAENQTLATAPIATASTRLEQDLGSSLNRIRISTGQLNKDTSRGLLENRQDTGRDKKLTKLDFGRDLFERSRKEQRGIREQVAGDADLLQQEVYSAHQAHPGVFGKFGRKKKKGQV